MPVGYFDIPGVASLEQEQATASFMFKGNIAEILHKIDGLGVSDILIEEPTLEEIFMHYYQDEA